jgi:hypothetical protein
MSDTAIHLHVHTGDRGPDTPPAIRDLTGGDPDAYPKDLDDLHARLIRWFEASELARMDEIDLAQRDRDYVDHNQYTRDELKVLRERDQQDQGKAGVALRPGAQGAHRSQGIRAHASRGRPRRCGDAVLALHRRRQLVLAAS